MTDAETLNGSAASVLREVPFLSRQISGCGFRQGASANPQGGGSKRP